MINIMRNWRRMAALLCVLTLCALPALAAAANGEVRVLEKSTGTQAATVESATPSKNNEKSDGTSSAVTSQVGEAQQEKSEMVVISSPDSSFGSAGMSVGLAELLSAMVVPPEEAEPGELLNSRIFQALAAGKKLQGSLRFALGDVQDVPAEEMEPVRDLLENLELKVGFGVKDGKVEADLELVVAGKAAFTGKAYSIDQGIILETNLLPGKALLLSYEKINAMIEQGMSLSQFDQETIDALTQSLMTYAGVFGTWVEPILSGADATEEAVAATEARDASAFQVKVRITGDDYKRLYSLLGDAFAADTGLHGALAKLTGATEEEIVSGGNELFSAMEDMKPTANAYTIDMYVGENGDVVGADYKMLPLFEGNPVAGDASYSRKTQDALTAHSLSFDIGDGGADGFSLQAKLTTDESKPGVEAGELELQASGADEENSSVSVKSQYTIDRTKPRALILDMTMQSLQEMTIGEKQGIVSYDITEHSESEISGMVETYKEEGTVTMRMEGDAYAGLDTSAMSGWMTADGMPVSYTAEATTEALAGDDFRTGTQMKMGIVNAELIMNWAMESADYTPSDAAGKTVVDLLGMSPSEGEALSGELQTYAMQALMGAVGRLPQSVLMYIQNMSVE